MDFRLHAWRFRFRPSDPVHFPQGKSGNILRGSFGALFRRLACVPECPGTHACDRRNACPYACIFEPRSESGPSGLLDSPRPFVFRAAHLDGRTVLPGQSFHFDLHVFDTKAHVLPYFVQAFSQVAREGLGPRRGRAALTSVSRIRETGQFERIYDAHSGTLFEAPPLFLSLAPHSGRVWRVRLTFLTPTELKTESRLAERPVFEVLFGRARDRVSTLRRLYDDGPLKLDYRGMGERARTVQMTRCDLAWANAHRRSSRTGQTHSLGGFIGTAEYTGELAEFLPVLKVAQWTGVGRQTVWGKGAIRVEEIL